MAFISTSGSTLQSKLATILQPKNLHPLREVGNILSKKKFKKAHILLKLKKKGMYPTPTYCQHYKLCRKYITAVPYAYTFSYLQDYSYPLPVYTVQPFSIIAPRSRPIYATNICPYARAVVQPLISPMVPQTYVQENGQSNIFNYLNDLIFSAEPLQWVTEVENKQTYNIQSEAAAQLKDTAVINTEIETTNIWNQDTENNSLDDYLTLPKELFPTARMLALDPNPIIDELCKLPNVQRHTPWLLDLEFGIPRTAVTRPIPIYNVKFNSINCKNTPDAVHPAFERCNPDFKKVLLFYYDSVVSAWYRGYIIMNDDRSVENFQSWLLQPMQVLGMCWA